MLLAFAPVTSAARAQRFELSADTALIDEPIGIAVSHLPRGATVIVRIVSPGQGWTSNATFRADDNGRIDLTRQAPISGEYRGVHAMGLFWSATRDNNAGEAVGPMRAVVARVPPPEPWILTAEIDGRVVATDTLWQRVMNPDVRVVPVRDSGIVGVAYFPPDSGPH